ncbi:hypothetical protein ABT173_43360 [Streptomyces sp. NPDC001795]
MHGERFGAAQPGRLHDLQRNHFTGRGFLVVPLVNVVLSAVPG